MRGTKTVVPKAQEENCKQAELEKKKAGGKEAEMEKAKGSLLLRRSRNLPMQKLSGFAKPCYCSTIKSL
ncbi:hypothetical protein TSUD_216890 [Trifolium subterraneum]|uniref:Uncharacterized protein n=1 Tax=Trifolium subterraneum TaxID=3900 RepID=A0A2Z6M002_TRISU|nr:hypothetical protein TSUD_216890 [Trifolium subterraneum]